MKTLNSDSHDDLVENIEKSRYIIYMHIGLKRISTIKQDPECKKYGGYTFYLNNYFIRFRTAVVTPKKIGNFVTLWNRNTNNNIRPYGIDSSDFIIICVKNKSETKFGQFIFPNSLLGSKNILSTNKKNGKLSFRVYPIWSKPISKQAINTQKWQIKYFIDMSDIYEVNIGKAKKIFFHN